MGLAPAVPVAERELEGPPARRLLAVMAGQRRRDERTLRWACALAQEHQAELTVLCLWSFPPMWSWISLSGAGAAVQMLELHRRELQSWLRSWLDGVLDQPARILSARHPESAARIVCAELERGRYTCVVGSRRTFGPLAAQRLHRARPGLTLVRL